MASDSVASVSLQANSSTLPMGSNRTRISRGEIILERQHSSSNERNTARQVEIANETLNK